MWKIKSHFPEKTDLLLTEDQQLNNTLWFYTPNDIGIIVYSFTGSYYLKTNLVPVQLHKLLLVFQKVS